jgi:hypothetical protein
LHHYRHSPDPRLRTRVYILLLLADGHPWVVIAAPLFTSSSTIDRWQRRFRAGGVAARLEGEPVGDAVQRAAEALGPAQRGRLAGQRQEDRLEGVLGVAGLAGAAGHQAAQVR